MQMRTQSKNHKIIRTVLLVDSFASDSWLRVVYFSV